jgi:hypothetical protein
MKLMQYLDQIQHREDAPLQRAKELAADINVLADEKKASRYLKATVRHNVITIESKDEKLEVTAFTRDLWSTDDFHLLDDAEMFAQVWKVIG